jgi:hypothetical protein
VIATSLWTRLANGIGLIIALALISGPLWNFVPHSMTPLSSPLGKVRFGCAILLCHVGLVFWPAAWWLTRAIVRQPWSIEWVRLAALIAICVWQGLGCARCVARLWTIFFQWVT